MTKKNSFLLKKSEIAQQEIDFSHPWNPNSSISSTRLGHLVGLKRLGVNLAKIPPGKESFLYHAHDREEEWIYIISGRGIAEIDDEKFEIGAGDFMGFPTPSVGHHLSNPFDEELVYLMGGENLDFESVDFPHLSKRMLCRRGKIEIYNFSDAKGFSPLEET